MPALSWRSLAITYDPAGPYPHASMYMAALA